MITVVEKRRERKKMLTKALLNKAIEEARDRVAIVDRTMAPLV